jgi:hypothetical protein
LLRRVLNRVPFIFVIKYRISYLYMFLLFLV